MTKGLQFVPSDKEAGLFEAEIFPTRIGSYSLVLDGMIQEQPISDEVSIEDVESKQRISFPQSAGDSSVGSGSGAFNINFAGQLSNIIGQTTEDVDNVKQDINTLATGNADLDRGIENVMGTFDAFYMIAVTAIGAAAGIIIGSAALVLTR